MDAVRGPPRQGSSPVDPGGGLCPRAYALDVPGQAHWLTAKHGFRITPAARSAQTFMVDAYDRIRLPYPYPADETRLHAVCFGPSSQRSLYSPVFYLLWIRRRASSAQVRAVRLPVRIVDIVYQRHLRP